MLDKRVFLRELGMLAERFGRTISEPVMLRYFESLSRELTTPEFEHAARVIFDEDQFWPSPRRFVEAVHGSVKERGNEAWALALKCASAGAPLPELPAGENAVAVRAAVRAVGGLRQLGSTHEAGLRSVRADFLDAYERELRAQRSAVPEAVERGRLPSVAEA